MKKLLIFPYNGNALEAIDCIRGSHEFLGFIDDSPEKQGKVYFGYKVYSREAIMNFSEAEILAVPGNPENYIERIKIIESLNIPKTRYAKLIHPGAFISNLSEIGYNTLIMSGVSITSNSKIGNHVCILPGTVIHHDTAIGDYTLIGSNVSISGFTEIGMNCYIGSGSNIINNITVGDFSLIGLGSNVIKPVKKNSKVAGDPAGHI